MVQHLNFFRKLGIDFIIFSWWGKNSPSDNNTKLILNQIKENYTEIKFFLMVEEFGDGWLDAYNESSSKYNFGVIYDYIYNNYIAEFKSNTFNLDGKPAIGFYDSPNRTFTRLARFNVQINTVERGRFNGLPIPAAATFVASLIMLFYYLGGSGNFKHLAVLLSIYVLAFLMVSTVRYSSFKDLEPFRRRPFNTLVVFIFFALLLAAEPQVMIFLSVSVYIVSGPVGELVGMLRGQRRKTLESEKSVDGHDAHGKDPREARGEGDG